MRKLRTAGPLAVALLAALATGGRYPIEAPRPPAAADTVPFRSGVFPPAWAMQPQLVPTVVAPAGMVASTDVVASEVGAEVLRRGGNAVDAAVATHFALAVVNPEAGNIGGGGFLVLQRANGERAALDFREKAPLRATREMFLDARGDPGDRSLIGALAAGVPGSVAGMWEAHRRYGTLPWAELLQPAITLAEGMVVHERLARSLRDYEAELRRFPATEAIFLPGGRPPRVGERFVQADLAETLRRIARDGRAGFYAGRTAELIEAEMKRDGGLISREDLARYEAKWRDPIVFDYRGHTVVSMPPPSSGGVALAQILNVLEGYDVRSLGFGSAAHVHLFAEAEKRAFADRRLHLADPDFVKAPVARLISDAYAAERRRGIRPDRATPLAELVPHAAAPAREGTHTTHYSVVDRAGNAVAVTTTINALYGNRVTVAGAGFLLNDEMDDFTITPGPRGTPRSVPGEVNAIEPGKRMLSSMTPTILLDPAGRVELVTGSPGGMTIISTVAGMISNVVDFGMDLPTATAAPRLHQQDVPDVLRYEVGGLRPEVAAALRAMGHQVEERAGYQGDVASIAPLPGGPAIGTSDPRRGGAPAGVREVVPVVQ